MSSSTTEKRRLHPASLWSEAVSVTRMVAEPATSRIRDWSGQWLRPASTLISPIGWLLLAAVVLFWFLGLAFDWIEAVVAALVGTLLLLLAIPFIVGRSIYGVELDLARTRVAVGDRAVGSVEVTNIAKRPMLPAALELPVGSATALFHLPRMKPGQVHEDLFTIPTARRAVIVVGPVRSVREDPLNLLRRQMKWTEPQDLFVHPATTALVGSASGFIRDLEGLPTRELSNSDVSFHALRDYVPGDDRRHIHWKTTARTGQLMVRQFEETRRAHLAIAVSMNTAEYATDEDLELAISVGASIGLQAIREERNLSVLTQFGPLRTQTGKNMLDDMTRLNGARLRQHAVELARKTADAVPNASVAFLVVGQHVSPTQLRSAAAAIPTGIRCFAIRCQTGATVSRASIGDLTVLTIGKLSELGIVLQRAAA